MNSIIDHHIDEDLIHKFLYKRKPKIVMQSGSTNIILLDDKVAFTVYHDGFSQIFHTELGCYVYQKVEDKLVHLELDAWTKLVMKIEREIEYYKHNKPDGWH